MTVPVSPTSPATVSLADLRELVAVATRRHPEERARIERAAAIVLLRRVIPDPKYVDSVLVESESQPDTYHSVGPNTGTCSCRDFQHRGLRCKHLWSLRLLRAILNSGRGAIAPAA
jgi:SWIM zinc finger